MRQVKENNKLNIADIDRSKEIIKWAIDFIKDELPDWEGQEVYGCDLANEITQGPNNNGIYENDSWGFISKHINDARDEYEYEKNNFGDVLHNPFDNPEAFVVCMLINTVNDILSQVPIIDEHWNDSLELNEENINQILEYLKID